MNETPVSLVERPTQELVNLLLTNRDEDEADSVYACRAHIEIDTECIHKDTASMAIFSFFFYLSFL